MPRPTKRVLDKELLVEMKKLLRSGGSYFGAITPENCWVSIYKTDLKALIEAIEEAVDNQLLQNFTESKVPQEENNNGRKKRSSGSSTPSTSGAS